MNKKYLIVTSIIVLLVIGVVVWVGMKNKTKPHYADAVRMNRVLAKEVIVTLDSSGFSPKSVTIKPGTVVQWVNKSGKPQTVNSNNYPTNQLHKELNFGGFANGSSVVYTFTKAGTYGYHNQYRHDQEGKVS